MLNLKELEASLDLALSHETEQSLLNWLRSVKIKEVLINFERYIFSYISFNGTSQLRDKLAFDEGQVINIDRIKGVIKCDAIHMKIGNIETGPPKAHVETLFEYKKTPDNLSGVFLCNIAACQILQRPHFHL